jgi:hypothetical protein
LPEEAILDLVWGHLWDESLVKSLRAQASLEKGASMVWGCTKLGEERCIWYSVGALALLRKILCKEKGGRIHSWREAHP